MTGIGEAFLISPITSAESRSGIETLTISHPASASIFIWVKVAETSLVSVLVMDWTEIGALPPIKIFPN